MLNGDTGAAAEALARRITDLMQAADLPTTLSACGVSAGILPVLAEEAAQQWTGRFNPRPVAEADLLALYESGAIERQAKYPMIERRQYQMSQARSGDGERAAG